MVTRLIFIVPTSHLPPITSCCRLLATNFTPIALITLFTISQWSPPYNFCHFSLATTHLLSLINAHQTKTHCLLLNYNCHWSLVTSFLWPVVIKLTLNTYITPPIINHHSPLFINHLSPTITKHLSSLLLTINNTP